MLQKTNMSSSIPSIQATQISPRVSPALIKMGTFHSHSYFRIDNTKLIATLKPYTATPPNIPGRGIYTCLTHLYSSTALCAITSRGAIGFWAVNAALVSSPGRKLHSN